MKATVHLLKERRATALQRTTRAKVADNEPRASVSPSVEPCNSQLVKFDYRQSRVKPVSKNWLKIECLFRICEMRSDKKRTHECNCHGNHLCSVACAVACLHRLLDWS